MIVDERRLPSPDALRDLFERAHDAGRPVAVHCVTRAELVVTCAALEAAGVLTGDRADRGDRIEHASVAPPELAEWMARLGVTVVTSSRRWLGSTGARLAATFASPTETACSQRTGRSETGTRPRRAERLAR